MIREIGSAGVRDRNRRDAVHDVAADAGPMVLDRDHVRDDPVPGPWRPGRGRSPSPCRARPRGPVSDPRDPRGPINDPRGPAPRYPGGPTTGSGGRARDEPLNLGVLREITEHSGGRTEVIRMATRSRSRHQQHRRRAEPPVLPRLPGRGIEGRPLALDSPRGDRQRRLHRPLPPRLHRDALKGRCCGAGCSVLGASC